jgi:hypothetical protein
MWCIVGNRNRITACVMNEVWVMLPNKVLIWKLGIGSIRHGQDPDCWVLLLKLFLIKVLSIPIVELYNLVVEIGALTSVLCH